MASWRNPLRDIRPLTVTMFLILGMWATFQALDPTPPPVLDQILIAIFGAWIARETVDRKNERTKGDEPKDDTAAPASISNDGEKGKVGDKQTEEDETG
ncbi:hypothetical protein OLP41_gp085 [Mycobacterium phage I3]|uniref:Uncharacterized protein n=2 Tax=Bixzunavirus TaxID=680114 RepID=A0A8F2IWW0_9CAUD|nr:hypothetical protein KHO59_gp068 [Mycobacterium phage Cane17]YP_010510493.1 hypothetical protein OLP41_gp085 [Mycobacterium phage I3]AXQ51682.1 hypothetical protein SEA_CANE17_68 [Mycobacterium phage Cane17]QWT30366.1 hypothetical protein PBI_I3_85 [Mycobacterium phage I3]